MYRRHRLVPRPRLLHYFLDFLNHQRFQDCLLHLQHHLYLLRHCYQDYQSYQLYLDYLPYHLHHLLHYRQRRHYHLHHLGMLIDFQMLKYFLLYQLRLLCRLLLLCQLYLPHPRLPGYQRHQV